METYQEYLENIEDEKSRPAYKPRIWTEKEWEAVQAGRERRAKEQAARPQLDIIKGEWDEIQRQLVSDENNKMLDIVVARSTDFDKLRILLNGVSVLEFTHGPGDKLNIEILDRTNLNIIGDL